jgi:ribosomal protein L44E
MSEQERANMRLVWRMYARQQRGYKGSKRGRPLKQDQPTQQPVSQCEILSQEAQQSA